MKKALMFTTDDGVTIRFADEIICPRGHRNGVHSVVIEPRRIRIICQHPKCQQDFVTIESPVTIVAT
jgi:hypothetical protein